MIIGCPGNKMIGYFLKYTFNRLKYSIKNKMKNVLFPADNLSNVYIYIPKYNIVFE